MFAKYICSVLSMLLRQLTLRMTSYALMRSETAVISNVLNLTVVYYDIPEVTNNKEDASWSSNKSLYMMDQLQSSGRGEAGCMRMRHQCLQPRPLIESNAEKPWDGDLPHFALRQAWQRSQRDGRQCGASHFVFVWRALVGSYDGGVTRASAPALPIEGRLAFATSDCDVWSQSVWVKGESDQGP